MSINYKQIHQYLITTLGLIIISSLILTPRMTLNTLKPCEKHDINIVYKFGHTHAWDNHRRYNELNTYRGTYTKDMIDKGTITARLCINLEELEQILDKANEINFINYPEHSLPNNEGIRSSSSHTYRHILTISNGTHENTVQWNSIGYFKGEDVWLNNLIDISKMITDIVESKPEYQDLPRPTAGYA